MRGHTKLVLLIVTVLVLIVTAMAALRGQDQDRSSSKEQKTISKEEFESQFPIADYSAPELADPVKRAKRKAKSKKYDNSEMSVSPSGDVTSSFEHWATGLSALPVNRSCAVVIGEVLGAQAYLSNDKTGVYSEFNIRVDKVLKNASASLATGKDIVVERPGGRVRFPSGHVNQYFTVGQGMPRVGRRYILFLTGNEQDFQILTGYEIRAGHIFLLDNPGGGHPITAYKGMDEALLLNDLQVAIANSSQTPLK
jgi:hypothetical protein